MDRYEFIGYHTAEGIRFAAIYFDWWYFDWRCDDLFV